MDGSEGRGWVGARTGNGWELGQRMDGSEGRGWVGARTGDGWELGQGMYEGE